MCPAREASVSGGATNGRVVLRADGASRGNPGPAAIAYVLLDARGRELAAEGRCIGQATNNEAEYRALIAGLERAKTLPAGELDIRLDSELVVFQLTGRYRVRTPHLVPLHERARTLLSAFSKVTVRHVPRRENARSDQLANLALDEAARRRRGLPSSSPAK
ncbi:MAG: ribonuclease HI family protein [Chloroflexota bacterium]